MHHLTLNLFCWSEIGTCWPMAERCQADISGGSTAALLIKRSVRTKQVGLPGYLSVLHGHLDSRKRRRRCTGNDQDGDATSANQWVPPSLLVRTLLCTCWVGDFDCDFWVGEAALHQRLALLQWLHRYWERDSAKVAATFGAQIKRAGLLQANPQLKAEDVEASRVETMGHFFLKLVFSLLDADAQEWFIQQEVKLLQHRLGELQRRIDAEKLLGTTADSAEQSCRCADFLQALGVPFATVQGSATVKYRLEGMDGDARALTLYQIGFWPFGTSLASSRRVVLQGGYCYASEQQIFNVVVPEAFRTKLRSGLRLLAAAHGAGGSAEIGAGPRLDSRFRALAKTVNLTYRAVAVLPAQQLTPGGSLRLSLGNIRTLSACFPPCMRHLYRNLLRLQHLKHRGRLQLWMFFKGAGMTLEEQLTLWRGLWGDKVQFDKEIAYNIRHSYGQEGKRTDYTAFSCAKVIHQPLPGPGEFHGCPLYTMEGSTLEKFLASDYQVREFGPVGELIRRKDLQLACVDIWRCSAGGRQPDTVGNHPNMFFSELVQ